jgi:hypothetical protein
VLFFNCTFTNKKYKNMSDEEINKNPEEQNEIAHEENVVNEIADENKKETSSQHHDLNMKKFFWIVLMIFVTILFVLSVFVLLSKMNDGKSGQQQSDKVQNMSISTSTQKDNKDNKNETKNTKVLSGFQIYKEVPVNVEPKIKDYPIEEDLSNITNKDDFTFSDDAEEKLAENGFVVVPSYEDEFFQIYERNRYAYVPNFITTDSILHNYHLMFDATLKQLEEQKLAPELKKLSSKMFTESLRQYDELKGTDFENPAKRNVAFFAVAMELLGESADVPEFVNDEVAEELDLIEKHEGINTSPVMSIGAGEEDLPVEDYTQYIPRGHYNKTEELKNYFKAMMWYGRLTFRLKNSDEVKSAILITLALNENGNKFIWNKIYEPINFFVGKSDDITYYQFSDLLEKVYGDDVSAQTVAENTEKVSEFINEAEKLSSPQINSIPIFNADIQDDKESETKGFRFMGQRFTIDASIFQKLTVREVGKKDDSCDDAPFATGRMLPKGLDIAASFGSDEAMSILEDEGETEYACYPENITKIKEHLSKLTIKDWRQNLYWSWLYQLLPLLEEKGDGYPMFMRNTAWTRKSLSIFLGSWTELKHDTILYAKQSYAELGGGGEPDEKDDRGYVEPVPEVYARLASLIKMTAKGLEDRGLLTNDMDDNFKRMGRLAMSLKVISEKELREESLNDDEYELIRSYGGQLEHLWIEVNKNEKAFKESSNQMDYLNENPAALVADVATDPNGVVLEEGTGHVLNIYAVVPVDGKLRIARGGVYSYYEFTQPMSDRLTDKKWREMLRDGENPNLPTWTDMFVAE